ncbi:isochorismatase domain-containing protein 2-like [Babylonia areolata]|uniref:isochorismatase domain-containing protein 2-like n=1 Tax=Babylonia areolata TaxID=304850 RepID=UPI003FD39D65
MAAKKIGKLAVKNSCLFLCDMQEKFRPTIQYFPQIVSVASRMLQGSRVLDMPVVVTEQYPKGLGHTVPELGVKDEKIFPKTCFSMVLPEVEEYLKQMGDVKSVVLCGIETQACVLMTTLDLIERGYDVHVIADACSSRSMVDRMFALERMREAGAYLTTSESMLLQLCGGAAHPKFRDVQKIIWEPAPDSGLLTGAPQDGSSA